MRDVGRVAMMDRAGSGNVTWRHVKYSGFTKTKTRRMVIFKTRLVNLIENPTIYRWCQLWTTVGGGWGRHVQVKLPAKIGLDPRRESVALEIEFT